jgi:hypothetical protein
MTTPEVERQINVQCTGLPDVDSALAWVVRTYDAEFKGAVTWININIHQYKEEDSDDWLFIASVGGRTEVPTAVKP